MHQFHRFILSWNSACFGEFVCPSSGVYSLYTQQSYMACRFVDSFILVLLESCLQTCMTYTIAECYQWINSWWWTDELSETCWVSWQNEFVKLVHLVGFITKRQTRLLANGKLKSIFGHKGGGVKGERGMIHCWFILN